MLIFGKGKSQKLIGGWVRECVAEGGSGQAKEKTQKSGAKNKPPEMPRLFFSFSIVQTSSKCGKNETLTMYIRTLVLHY